VAEEVEKEGIVPSGALDFLAQGYGVGMRANDIGGKSSQDREVLWSIVFSCTIAILAEHDVEHPMQAVLDAPMTAHNLQQSFGWNVLGKQVIAHGRLVGAAAMEASARGDARDGDHTGKAVCGSDVGVANDGGTPGFVTVVSGRFQLLGDAALAGAGKAPRDGIEHFALILLERQRIVAATFEHCLGKRPIAVQRIAGNDTAFERHRQVGNDVENPDGSMPLEKQLQQDYLRFLRASKLGTHDEVRGLAAGRADVFHELGRVRIITEIKREPDDASFDALLENYGEQTAAYQNTNVPLGMLMALDLTKGQSVGQHISALYRAAVGDFLEDGVRRGVLVVKIPANRISPAVATQRGRKRHQGRNSQSVKPARRRSSARNSA
jgi:hypothetical protein